MPGGPDDLIPRGGGEREAKMGPVRLCATCHRASFCADCHTHSVEMKPSLKYGNRPDRQMPHRGDFLTLHKIEGKLDPGNCYRCHGQDGRYAVTWTAASYEVMVDSITTATLESHYDVAVRDGGGNLLDTCAQPGLYHCVNSGYGTWYEVAEEAARVLGVNYSTVQQAVTAAERKARIHGIAPKYDLTHEVPPPFVVKGVSTLYDEGGNLRLQWVKSKLDDEKFMEMLKEIVTDLVKDAKGMSRPVPPPEVVEEDLAMLILLLRRTEHLAIINKAARAR